MGLRTIGLLDIGLRKTSRGVVAGPPDVDPDGLVLTPSGDDMILNWNDNSTNEDGFSIERSVNGVTYAEIDTVTAGVDTYTDTTTANGTLYYYRVRAFRGTVYSSYCTAVSSYTYGAELVDDPNYNDGSKWNYPATYSGGKFSPVADTNLNYNVYILAYSTLTAGKYKIEIYVDSYTSGTANTYVGGTQVALGISGSGLVTKTLTSAASNQFAGINCMALTAVIDRISIRRDYN